MKPEDPRDSQLQRLRQWRNRPERDLSMAFLKPLFKREVEKPYKQLGQLVGVWEALVPAELLPHTRLESLSRGVLRVVVDSSARLYELDRLLRGGLERDLVVNFKGPAFRRVQLRVGQVSSPGE